MLSVGDSEGRTPEAVNVENFSFEFTVNSPGENSAKFDLVITGFTLSEDGGKTPFKLEKQELETPYKLILRNGEYQAIIENKSQDLVVVSKVQGIENGKGMGFSSGQFNQTILDFGAGGKYAAKGSK